MMRDGTMAERAMTRGMGLLVVVQLASGIAALFTCSFGIDR